MEKLCFAMAEKIAVDWYAENEIPDTEEAKNASSELYALYWNDAKFSDIRFELETLIFRRVYLHEKQGFLAGFRYALELLSEEVKA